MQLNAQKQMPTAPSLPHTLASPSLIMVIIIANRPNNGTLKLGIKKEGFFGFQGRGFRDFVSPARWRRPPEEGGGEAGSVIGKS